MNTCPHCGHKNQNSAMLCERCGRFLIQNSQAVLQTKRVDAAQSPAAVATSRARKLHPQQTVFFQLKGVGNSFALKPSMSVIVIGRSDANSTSKPDIDLTPFDAYKKGVSRIHANIYRKDDTLMIVDQGSANGTFLNGQRLLPNEVRLLHDGDEIGLGQIAGRIFFGS
jgi:pSer/pThr/pTyr-binding forkhead associated (FHA) protein